MEIAIGYCYHAIIATVPNLSLRQGSSKGSANFYEIFLILDLNHCFYVMFLLKRWTISFSQTLPNWVRLVLVR
jgi:hypothetical protein